MAYDSLGELRSNFFDSNDPFMTKGHRILKRLRREKDVPTWVLNNSLVQKVLLKSFPNLQTDPKQRARAGRWLRVIDLYFRQSWSRKEISSELKMSYLAVDTLVRSILRAGEGRRSDGSPKPLGQPRGRPRGRRRKRKSMPV